ncbi:H3 histone acetyltransferase RTT109 [Rhodotorula paludigena]|uniref:H3 histone acetyltransferase RTT109 n=1 Tax=Rhodotorula paludigena TaxID=86838 RepID=UPI003179CF25
MAPSLVDFLCTSLAASVAGTREYRVHAVRSEPQRSHALFPHATNAKTAKVWHEELLVVLSEKRVVPAAHATPASEGAPAVTNGAVEPVADASNASGSGAPAVAAPSTSASTSSADEPAQTCHERFAPVVGIEASIYTIPSSSTSLLYISKVDTTGLSSGGPSPTRTLVSSFLAYHVLHPPHGTQRLRVHVFARAQGQYLFPGSVDNPGKRVLDDKGLIRWWKATIERAVARDDVRARAASTAGEEAKDAPLRLFYLVPGLSYLESLPYVPAAHASSSSSPPPPAWTYSHPYTSLSSPLHPPSAPSAHPLPDHIPSFPDDPKSRFLHSLTSSTTSSSGTPGDYDDVYLSLRSATFSTGQTGAQRLADVERAVERERTRLLPAGGVPGGVDEFWERLAFRQECCDGHLVAFFVVAAGEGAGEERTTHPVAASRRHALALRPASYTKLWSQLHNYDYSLGALARLADAVERWDDGVERAARAARDEDAEAKGEGAAGEGGGEGEGEAEWRGAVECELRRDVRVDNPHLVRVAGEKRGAEEGEGASAGAAPKVNVLAPRKKKKVAPA